MSVENNEVEQVAEDLQQRLNTFASMETSDREKYLPELAAFILKNVKMEILKKLINKEFQKKLEHAIKATLGTPFDVEGKKVIPWQGGYTIVVLDDKGSVAGADFKPVEAIVNAYGDVAPYALSKALFLMHLEKSGHKGGMDNQSNYDYIKKLLPPEIPVFTGASQESLFLNKNNYYIGGSGCAVKKDYLSTLLGGAIPTVNTQAGSFDCVFSELIRDYLSNPLPPGSLPRIRPEPEMVQNIRRNN